MKSIRSYYSASLQEFLSTDSSAVLGDIVKHSQTAQLNDLQKCSWEEEITILNDQLNSFHDGFIIFE